MDTQGGSAQSCVVRMDDEQFKKHGEPCSRNADAITITFWRQKNAEKGATVTQHRKDNLGQSEICPIWTLANLTARIQGCKQIHRTNAMMNAFATKDLHKIQCISSKTIVLQRFRVATMLTDKEQLGLWTNHIGTHLIRSVTAMVRM